MNVLVINCGSSSVKYALFDADENILISGKRERLGQKSDDRKETHAQAIATIFSELGKHQIDAVGHRVVHGGEECHESCLLNDRVKAAIERQVSMVSLISTLPGLQPSSCSARWMNCV